MGTMPNGPLILSIHEQPNVPIAIPRDKIKINHTSSPKHLTKCKCGKMFERETFSFGFVKSTGLHLDFIFGGQCQEKKNYLAHCRVFHAPQPLQWPLLESISIGLTTFLLTVKSFLTFQIDHHKAKIQDLERPSSREGLEVGTNFFWMCHVNSFLEMKNPSFNSYIWKCELHSIPKTGKPHHHEDTFCSFFSLFLSALHFRPLHK